MSTTVGDEQLFAVRWEVEHTSHHWVLGKLEFVIAGKRVGDWEDTTALNAAFGWMREFTESSGGLDDHKLMTADKETVVALLHDRYMVYKITNHDLGKDKLSPTADHLISYLGMSSLDNWVLILVKGSDSQRVVWTNREDKIINEAFLPPETIQSVLTLARERFYARQV